MALAIATLPFSALASASVQDLLRIEGFGEKTAAAVHGWLADPANRALLGELAAVGVVPAANVISIDILGGDDGNTIDLGGVTAAVEYAVMARRDHHMSRLDALIDACHKRARPIVMTTIAMGAGMLPIALFPPLWRRVMDHRVVEHLDGDVTVAQVIGCTG